MEYINIKNQEKLPNVRHHNPFKCIVIIDEKVDSTWQGEVSKWLVESGCMYMMAWGIECSSWDDSVDYANIERFNFGKIPEEFFVMTTWHENKSLSDVFRYSKYVAFHETHDLTNLLVLHISNFAKKAQIIKEFRNVYEANQDD